jgi:iron complex outermembrane recepter protein
MCLRSGIFSVSFRHGGAGRRCAGLYRHRAEEGDIIMVVTSDVTAKSNSNRFGFKGIAPALILAVAFGPGSGRGHAADAAATVTPPELKEVIVTAQKRAQNLQDVPIAVIALSGQQLQDAGVTNIKNLTELTPGLTVTSTTSENSTTARIRGIGTVGDNVGLESSVGVVIDGVYRPRNGVGFGDLGDIASVQVLEGPQGELFGKNNDAGVIVIETKRPSRTFGVSGEITGGNFGDKEISGAVTGPVGDTSAFRLYAEYKKRDGFLNVETGTGNSGDAADNRNLYLVRGEYLFTPSSDLSLLLIGDFSRRNEVCCQATPVYPGPFAGIITALATNPLLGGTSGQVGFPDTPTSPFDRQSFANYPISQQIWDRGFSAQLNWDLGDAQLTSISAWRDNSIAAGNDPDYSEVALIQEPANGNVTDFKQMSEELRLAGKSGRLNWLIGGFADKELLNLTSTILADDDFDLYLGGTATAAAGVMPPNFLLLTELTGNLPGHTFIPGISGQADAYEQTERSYAFFTNETYSLMAHLDLTAGLRYTHEAKDDMASYHNPDGGAACGQLLTAPPPSLALPYVQTLLLGYGCATPFNPFFNGITHPQSLGENDLNATVKLDYHFTDDVMGYVSWGNGTKAGGFNLARVTNPAAADPLAPILDTEFPRETVNSFEVGLKSELADKTVRLNGDVFEQQYRNFQLNTFTGIVFVVSSLPDVNSKGAELQLDWLTPLSGLSFAGGVVYADTEITKFGDSLYLFAANRENNRLSFSPLWSGVLSATDEVPLTSSLTLRLSADEKYSSSYNTGSDLDPLKIQGAYGLLDARIGIGPPDGRWSFEVWGQNLTDKGYFQVAFDAPFQGLAVPGFNNQIDSFVGDPRTFGATIRFRF